MYSHSCKHKQGLALLRSMTTYSTLNALNIQDGIIIPDYSQENNLINYSGYGISYVSNLHNCL